MKLSQLALSALVAASSAQASIEIDQDLNFDDVVAPQAAKAPKQEKATEKPKIEHPPFQVCIVASQCL